MLQLHVVLQLHAGFNSLHTGVLTLFSAPRLQFFLPSICELWKNDKRQSEIKKVHPVFREKLGKINQAQLSHRMKSQTVYRYSIFQTLCVTETIVPGVRLKTSFRWTGMESS